MGSLITSMQDISRVLWDLQFHVSVESSTQNHIPLVLMEDLFLFIHIVACNIIKLHEF